MNVYISSIEYVYEELIDTKKLNWKETIQEKKRKRKKGAFSISWLHQPWLNVPVPWQVVEPPLF